MSSKPHSVVNLTENSSGPRSSGRSGLYDSRFKRLRDEKAIESLLGNHLKKIKSEDSGSVKLEGQSAGESLRLHTTVTPDFEWWDQVILDRSDCITHLVEHPVPLKGTTAFSKDRSVAKAILTPAERERLRKLRRKEKVTDMQDKIKMGLLKPPPPKIKMKTLAIALGGEAAQGPSAVEQAVKAQAADRLREHERHNAEHKLTPEQRRLKNAAKWTRPQEKADVASIAAYAIQCKVDNKAKFKICKNAEQLHLGGLFLNSRLKRENDETFYPSLVVVEGSRRAVKRFDRLVRHRIDWAAQHKDEDTKMEDNDRDSSDSDDAGDSECVRIFNGSEAKKQFSQFTHEELRDLPSALATLERKQCMHFWDMLASAGFCTVVAASGVADFTNAVDLALDAVVRDLKVAEDGGSGMCLSVTAGELRKVNLAPAAFEQAMTIARQVQSGQATEEKLRETLWNHPSFTEAQKKRIWEEVIFTNTRSERAMHASDAATHLAHANHQLWTIWDQIKRVCSDPETAIGKIDATLPTFIDAFGHDASEDSSDTVSVASTSAFSDRSGALDLDAPPADVSNLSFLDDKDDRAELRSTAEEINNLHRAVSTAKERMEFLRSMFGDIVAAGVTPGSLAAGGTRFEGLCESLKRRADTRDRTWISEALDDVSNLRVDGVPASALTTFKLVLQFGLQVLAQSD